MPYPLFKVGEPLHAGCDLFVRDAFDPDKDKGEEAQPISRGATGLVLRVMQADTIERAVKILAPEDRLLEAGNWDYFVGVFEREKRKLATLTHSHLAKLISFGRIPLTSESHKTGNLPAIPYIVMEFVEGRPLHKFIVDSLKEEAPTRLMDVVLNLLDDVLSALLYMHQQNAVHCDVKEANILVRRTHRAEAILVDLGAAHVFTGPRSDTTRYITTPTRVGKVWQERVGKDLPADLICESRVALDLHMFGAMLYLFLDENLPDNRVRYDWQPDVLSALSQILGDLEIAVLKRVAEKCLNESYLSATEVQQDLAAINRNIISPLGIAELSLGTNTKTSLALPEDSVPITTRIAAIVNHPCVQRLRRIPQLDFVSMIYIGATHSRLLHSVETYNLTRRYVGKLLGDPTFRAYCAERPKLEAVLLAGLLHDIGHYPLEHIFEDFALRSESAGPFAGILRDEDVTSALLGSSSAGSTFIESAAQRYLTTCERVLRIHSLPPIADLISDLFGSRVLTYLQNILGYTDESDNGISILRSIINGPLDVDKVSYLRTDSLYSGISYGRAIDVDSLLAGLTCTPEDAAIAITEKAICAAESIATGRRWMFQRVYWHKTNRAMMAMLRFAPQFLLEKGYLTFLEYFEYVYPLSDIEAIKWLDNKFSEATMGEPLENPAQLITDGRRGIYKLFLEFSAADNEGRDLKVRDYLMNRSCTEWTSITEDLVKIAQRHTPDVRLSDILLDIPSARRPQIGDVAVMCGPSNTKRRLSEMSDEFRSAQQFFEKAAMTCRLFMHPALRRKMLEDRVLESFRRDVRDHLRSKAPR